TRLVSDWSSDVCSSDLGLAGARVNTIAINPQSPNILYAGSDGGRLFKSTDGGASWITSNSGISYFGGRYTAIEIRALKINPHNRSEERRVGKGGRSSGE